MLITSPAFTNNGSIPSKYTCDRDNISPPLEFHDIPKEAKTLALIVDDPDAPRGDWTHWVIWNIPASTNIITEGTTPSGIEGTTDFENTGWGGPCPPNDTHHYQFKLYALNIQLELPTSTTKQKLEEVMSGHILEQAVLIGLYQRK